MVREEGVEDQVDVDLFLLFVNDIIGPQLDVRQEHLAGLRETFTVLVASGEITVGREVIRDSERLHVGIVQPLAVFIPYTRASNYELIVEFCAGRVDMEIPLSPLRSSEPGSCHDGYFIMRSPHKGLSRDESTVAFGVA